FLTADDAEGLVVRPGATTDDATPNPNALAAQNLIRLAVLTGQHAWRDQADRLFDGIAAGAGDNLFAHLALLNALDLRLRADEISSNPRRQEATRLRLPETNDSDYESIRRERRSHMHRVLYGLVVLQTLLPLCAQAADEKILVELNSVETADNRCRVSFVIEN